MHEATKDVEVKGARYQIGRLTARDGSWILLQLTPKISKAMQQVREDEPDTFALAFISSVIEEIAQTDEDTFRRIQEHALTVCRRYEKDNVPMPVFLAGRGFAIKELEYDLVAVMALTCHALIFNLAPFFTEGGFQQMLSGLSPASNPAPSPN
ncbi:MAG TPA: hypothetical protein VKX25_19420 [Bryobacteraceae bacterium]|jgi:hypothetical protein|nr:hypothetical protein [Bryobacteraceae bacterium]